MAVCDTEEGYRGRFVTYLVEHKTGEITVHAFSTQEQFLAALKRQKFDIAVCGKGFAEVEREVKEQRIPLLLLKDQVPEQIAEAAGYPAGEQGPCASVFRYQPMEAILHEVQVLTGAWWMRGMQRAALMAGMEVIGVYSPIHHEMQMPFAMVFSELLAEKRKVLYVNLMAHSGFLEVFRLAGEYDLGEIILRLRNKRLHPETFLKSVYMADRISYIPPFGNPENLHDFTLEDYLAFLGFLEDRTDFEAVVLDFGEGLAGFGGMLKYCTSIYCPMKKGLFYECQMNHFLEYLDCQSGESLRERLHILNLPFSAKRIRGGEDVRRQLLWSEFGDYVREYFTGGAV